MVYRFFAVCVIACGLMLMLGACGDDPDVTTPDTSLTTQATSPNPHVLWGQYDVAIDGETGEVLITPLRSADFNANVVRVPSAADRSF